MKYKQEWEPTKIEICPFCGREFFGLGIHKNNCKGSFKIPDDFRYVLCPMKRHYNAKELVKSGVYIINGIGDNSKILTSIDECLECKYQDVIRDNIEYEWFPDWCCSYVSEIRNRNRNLPRWNLSIRNSKGKTVKDYINALPKEYPPMDSIWVPIQHYIPEKLR